MARTNNSYYALLGILGFGQMSGYGIKTWVDEGVGYFWDLDYKQIYPTLKKLVEVGYAEFDLEKNGNRPVSKVYRITEKGLEELRCWLKEPISAGKHRESELKLKLFFGHHVPVDVNIGHLQSFMEDNINFLSTLEELKQCIGQGEGNESSKHYRMATVMEGELKCNANIEWCQKTIEYLRSNIKG